MNPRSWLFIPLLTAVVSVATSHALGQMSYLENGVIKIACTPHLKRSGHTGRGGPEQGEFLLVATNLLDLPAEVIALIYRKRWTVELFFRFYKHILGCRHLLSHRPNGIEIQTYLAIIVCMLIALWTGRKPTLRTLEMIRFYFTGWADEEELTAHIAKLQAAKE